MKLSKNGLGLAVLILATMGVNVTESDLLTTLSVIGQLASFILMTINQVERDDITGFLFKK